MEKDQVDILKKRFLVILEEDIRKLSTVIKESYFETYNNLNDAERSASIDFSIFKDLVNNICFENLFHYEKRPFSKMSEGETEFYEEKIYDIPEDRLNLFNVLFEVSECKFIIPSSIYSITASLTNPKRLYYLFFFYIFHSLANSKLSLAQILDKSLIEWQTALRTKKLPIIFNIYLDRILIENNISNPPFQLKDTFHTEIKRLSPYKANTYIPHFIGYETEIPLFIYETNEEYEKNYMRDDYEIFTQMRNNFEKFKDFLCALFFHNYYLPNPHPIIKLPWWIEPECQYLKKFTKETDENFIYKEIRRLTETDFKIVLSTYSILNEKGFYDRSCFPLLFSVKNLAFSEPFKLDRVFYSHTLLEFLFSPNPPVDLSFKIPIDASLMISEDFNQFYQNFVLLRRMYNLRSKIIHGEDWIEVINDTIEKLNTIGFQIRNITGLFETFSEVILKILNCLITFPRIISSITESFEDSNLLSFREKRYEYLIQLGGLYEKENKNIPALKSFYEAFYTAQTLSDNKKILESGVKITQIFNIDERILVYSNEFKVYLKELSMISNYNSNRQTIAKDIQENISKLRAKTLPQSIVNNIKLKINAKIIMEELNLEEGPKIGKILSNIRMKINSGELKNDERIIRSYLKTIDLSNLK